MRLPGRATIVGAYVCPQGAFAIECTRSGSVLQVQRSLEVPLVLENAYQGADHLARTLRSAGIDHADVAIALRGFGVAHHVLQMPPARDEMLAPIIEREMRRLEPQLGDAVVSWTNLPTLDSDAPDAPPQRSVLAAAAPGDVAQVFSARLRESGFRLFHLTALPSAMQRLIEEFDTEPGASALVAPLPDGAFLGFSLGGGLRLVVEPPLPLDAETELAALAEEVELGVQFVRQQFHGVQIDRVVLVGGKDSLEDAETVLAERLHVPARRLAVRDLSPPALAALGALIDSRSPKPLALGGMTRERSDERPAAPLATAALIAVGLLILLGAWTVVETVRTRRATEALHVARRNVEQDSFGLAPLRSTADQRRLIRDATAALGLVVADRVELQEALAGIAAVTRIPVRLDSLNLKRAESGWSARMGGSVTGVTNARAVQALHDLYQELPRRLKVESLRLDELAYSDSLASDLGVAIVRFQMSFGIPSSRKD